MTVAINLLKNRHTLSESEYQKERAYYKYAVMALVIAVVITLAISIWQFIMIRRLNKIETDIGRSSKELAGLTEANAKQIYLKSRLKMITAFLDDRTIARLAIQNVFSLNIPGVTVTAASFEDDSVMRIQAISSDVFSFNQLVDYLESDNDFFLQIVNRGVTRLQDGKYQMNISLTIPKG